MSTPTTSALKSCNPILEKLIPIIERVKERVKKKRREKSCDFNLFDVFSPKETMHSKILAHLLDPNGTHGQGDLFLRGFLEMKKIDIDPKEGNWEVSCESERIDICLERKNPESIVIIENKSHGACDQKNQLYRYWHRKMYLDRSHKIHGDEEALIKFYKENEKRYKIVYLTWDGSKEPSENTLKRPPQIKGNAPKKLPLAPTPLSFSDLANCIRGLINEIPEENHRLKEYLQQYMDYSLNKINKNTMSAEIRESKIFSTFEKWDTILYLFENLESIQDNWLEHFFAKLKDLKIDPRWVVETAFDPWPKANHIFWRLKEEKYKNAPLQVCLSVNPECEEVTWGISLTYEPAGISERKRIAQSLCKHEYKILRNIFKYIDTSDDTSLKWWPAWWIISLKPSIDHTAVTPSQFLWYCEYMSKDVLSQMEKNLKNVFAQTELFINLIKEIKK